MSARSPTAKMPKSAAVRASRRRAPVGRRLDVVAELTRAARPSPRRRRRSRVRRRSPAERIAVRNPMRSRPGSAPDLVATAAPAAARCTGSPGTEPAIASSTAAVSRTDAREHVLVGQRAPELAEVGAERRAGARRLEPDEAAHRSRGCGSSRPCRCRARPGTMPAATAAAGAAARAARRAVEVPRVVRRRRTRAARS